MPSHSLMLTSSIAAIVFVLIYLALFYLTFIYNWGDGLRRIYRG